MPPLGTNYEQQDCTLARALEILGERWTMLVLRDCFYGVRRFTHLLEHLDVSRAVLTDRLTGLVEAGVLERRMEGGHPAYVLTDAGVATWPSLYALLRWGDTFGGGSAHSSRVRPRVVRHEDRRPGGVPSVRGRARAW